MLLGTCPLVSCTAVGSQALLLAYARRLLLRMRFGPVRLELAGLCPLSKSCVVPDNSHPCGCFA